MNRRWWDRLAFWRRIWDWCPECERNGIERAEAVNQVSYWRSNSDDIRVVAYARGILVERLLRDAAHAGALTRSDCERIAREIVAGENGPPLEVRELAAAELRRMADIAPATVDRADDPGPQVEVGKSFDQRGEGPFLSGDGASSR